MREKEIVAVVRCKNYKQKEVDRAVWKILKLLDFPVNEYKNKKVLIKPNVVGLFNENQEAIITNINIVKSIAKRFDNSLIGESSFTNTEIALRKTGYLGLKNIVVFEEKKLVKLRDNKAKFLKNFFLPEIVKKADLIINVPKLKTHTLTKMTGAIKNLYGCIPGGLKQVYHRKAKGDEQFSNLLVDIYQNIKPGLNIMDAVIAMEGEGPTSGNPRKVGYLIGSKNAVALDIVASKIMGYNPEEILAIKEAEKRFGKLSIKVVGEKIKNLHFKKPLSYKKRIVRAMIKGLVEEKIVCDTKKCSKCGDCFKHCPVKAISMNPYPEINTGKCIRCFCCIEICPTNAMHLEKSRKPLRFSGSLNSKENLR